MLKKSNGNLLKVAIALVGIVLIAVFAGGGFYVLTGYRLDAVEESAVKIEDAHKDDAAKMEIKQREQQIFLDGWYSGIADDIDYLDDKSHEQDKEIFGVKIELEHLGEKVDRNFKEQQKFQLEQKAVQKEILTEIKSLQR